MAWPSLQKNQKQYGHKTVVLLLGLHWALSFINMLKAQTTVLYSFWKEMRIAIPTIDCSFHFIHFAGCCISRKPFSICYLSGRWWMAKNNKYASINFNHIYEKTNTTTNPHNKNHPSLSSSSSSASYSAVSAPNKPHGRILVLTRPTPKLVTPPTPQPQQQQQQPPPPPNPIQHHQPRSEPGSDAISLRPLGRTGTGSPLLSVPVVVSNHDRDLPLLSPSPQPLKTDKFVPPHLRPGFVPREEAPPPGPESLRPNGRPKSGGGHDRMRRGDGPDAGILGRGSRPSSSG